MNATEPLSGQQIADAGLQGWALLMHYGLYGLETRIHTGTFAAGLRLVAAIGEAAANRPSPPELDLRADRVDVRVTSGYDVGGVTEADIDLARRITELAGGAEVECRSLSRIEFGLDSPDHGPIAPFWAAVWGGSVTSGDGWADVGDDHHAMPLIWFQRSGLEEPRQHWHPDILVDPSQVQPRIDAAVAAGGTLVTDEYAPRFWVLADPEGNKVCLCTWQGRI